MYNLYNEKFPSIDNDKRRATSSIFLQFPHNTFAILAMGS